MLLRKCMFQCSERSLFVPCAVRYSCFPKMLQCVRCIHLDGCNMSPKNICVKYWNVCLCSSTNTYLPKLPLYRQKVMVPSLILALLSGIHYHHTLEMLQQSVLWRPLWKQISSTYIKLTQPCCFWHLCVRVHVCMCTSVGILYICMYAMFDSFTCTLTCSPTSHHVLCRAQKAFN